MQEQSFPVFKPLVIFLAVFLILQLSWQQCRATPIERLIIDRATVASAARLVQFLWPESLASAQGHSLVSPYQRINVLNGCEGIEAVFLLTAALCACAMPWQRRLAACLLGLAFVFALNEMRIVALWWILAIRPKWFAVAHGTLLPVVLIAASLLFLLACVPRPVSTPS